MSETTAIYQDDYQAAFTGEENFLDFLREREHEAQWWREQASTLKFVPLEEGSVITGLLKSIFSMNGKEDILEDTMAHTGLMLKLDEDFYPVRSCAVKTIMNRARISGNGLTKVSKAELVEILNMCMATASGDALLRFADGKVSAIHGGDQSDYAVLEMPSLFQRTADFLRSHFKRPYFSGAHYEHALATAVWVLEGSDKMTEAYKRTLVAHGQQPDEMSAALRLVSSDVGVSGANLYPMLVCGKECRIIPLGSPIKLEHENGADLDKFDQKLVAVFGQYEVALEGLARLLDIQIDNPINAMLGVMKRIGITKKLAYLAAELFEAQYGTQPCTAHDLFYGIAEAPATLQAEGASATRVTQMEENAARALTIRWTDYDMPGTFKW